MLEKLIGVSRRLHSTQANVGLALRRTPLRQGDLSQGRASAGTKVHLTHNVSTPTLLRIWDVGVTMELHRPRWGCWYTKLGGVRPGWGWTLPYLAQVAAQHRHFPQSGVSLGTQVGH